MVKDYESSLPPGPILMMTKVIDTICAPLGCHSWRDFVPLGFADEPTDWLSHKVGDVTETFPGMLTYSEYLVSTNATSSPQTMFDFSFRTPSTVFGVLTTPTAMATVLVLVLLIRMIKSMCLPLFSSVGRQAGRSTHGVEWEKANEVRIVKFGEYVFRLLFHSAISTYGILYFHDKEWWDSSRGGTTTLFLGHPRHAVEVGMAWYYLVQSAYNAEALLSLCELSFVVQFRSICAQSSALMVSSQTEKAPSPSKVRRSGARHFQSPVVVRWSPTVRGDFNEMFVHHIVTNLLIIGSSHWRLTRIGSMVFLVHDVSDIPVDLSKLANFLKWHRATAFCFFSMCFTWLATRLTVLPFVIYRSVLFESYLLVTHEKLDPIYYYAYRPFFFVLIGLIILLHLAWFGMFLKMGYLLVMKNETHDLSEHKKGEVMGTGKKKKRSIAGKEAKND